jgi:hypothetical protein
MRRETVNRAIVNYLKHLNGSQWIVAEAYKFEFANYLQSNVNFRAQNDDTILSILLKSQTIKYYKQRGIQFIKKGGRETLKTFLQLHDIALFRQFQNSNFERMDWSRRSMSYPVLSAWLSSLFPSKFYPIPMTGFNQTITYLFETDLATFPKKGENYIIACQEYMEETRKELMKYPVEEIHLSVWNKFFQSNSALNIKQKTSFERVD